MITRDPAKRGGHRDDGHEEEILQADSESKKKSDEQRPKDSDQKNKIPDHWHG